MTPPCRILRREVCLRRHHRPGPELQPRRHHLGPRRDEQHWLVESDTQGTHRPRAQGIPQEKGTVIQILILEDSVSLVYLH